MEGLTGEPVGGGSSEFPEAGLSKIYLRAAVADCRTD
jgi:hypothetical protein